MVANKLAQALQTACFCSVIVVERRGAVDVFYKGGGDIEQTMKVAARSLALGVEVHFHNVETVLEDLECYRTSNNRSCALAVILAIACGVLAALSI